MKATNGSEREDHQKSSSVPSSSERLLLVAHENRCRDHNQTCGGDLHQAPPFGAQETLQKRQMEDSRSRGVEDTRRTRHGLQLSRAHRGSQTMKWPSQSLHGSALGPLHLC